MNYKKTLLIDLDGVLNKYSGEYDENYIPDIKNGAVEFLENLHFSGFDIKIFTTRNLLLTSKWLIKNNIDHLINDVTNVKTTAFLHIDDRCIRFDGNYNDTLEKIDNFKVYWK